jgi:hypothetical protein
MGFTPSSSTAKSAERGERRRAISVASREYRPLARRATGGTETAPSRSFRARGTISEGVSGKSIEGGRVLATAKLLPRGMLGSCAGISGGTKWS